MRTLDELTKIDLDELTVREWIEIIAVVAQQMDTDDGKSDAFVAVAKQWTPEQREMLGQVMLKTAMMGVGMIMALDEAANRLAGRDWKPINALMGTVQLIVEGMTADKVSLHIVSTSDFLRRKLNQQEYPH